MADRRPVVITSAMLIVLLCPSVVRADAGAPLVWVGFFHLFIGNALIGLVEGLLIGLLFRVRLGRMVGIMVLANYVSTGFGAYFLHWRGLPNPDVWPSTAADLYTAPDLIKRIVLLCFVASVVVEAPFCLWGLAGKKRRWPKALAASIAAQTLSYAALVPLYSSASGVSVYTHVQLDRTLSFAHPVPAFVYFIAPEDGDVYRIRTNGAERTKVLESHLTDSDARLLLREEPSGEWGLYAAWSYDGPSKSLQHDFATRAAVSAGALPEEPPRANGTWGNWGPAWNLRPDDARAWRVETGYWPLEGLAARNTVTDASLDVALETPIIAWLSRNASILPGDQVVYQLGDQIVLLDLNARKIGLITRGRGPLVLLDERP